MAWRAVIRIVIRLIHSGREVGESAAAAAVAVVVVVVASRGAPRRPVGRYTHVTCRVLYSPRRAPQLLVDAIAYAPELQRLLSSRRPILRADLYSNYCEEPTVNIPGCVTRLSFLKLKPSTYFSRYMVIGPLILNPPPPLKRTILSFS